jgi:hypothetical protein
MSWIKWSLTWEEEKKLYFRVGIEMMKTLTIYFLIVRFFFCKDKFYSNKLTPTQGVQRSNKTKGYK